MILLELFLGFLKVGCFAFGGAYSAIPLIRETVLSYGWIDEDTLLEMIAVGESTPGSIIVNLATYVGNVVGGVAGAAVATFAAVLPAFAIILLLTLLLRRVMRRPIVKAAFSGLTPCIVGVILATGIAMLLRLLLPAAEECFDWRPLAAAAILAALSFAAKPLFKKRLSPVALIGVSAVLGVLLFGF